MVSVTLPCESTLLSPLRVVTPTEITFAIHLLWMHSIICPQVLRNTTHDTILKLHQKTNFRIYIYKWSLKITFRFKIGNSSVKRRWHVAKAAMSLLLMNTRRGCFLLVLRSWPCGQGLRLKGLLSNSKGFGLICYQLLWDQTLICPDSVVNLEP